MKTISTFVLVLCVMLNVTGALAGANEEKIPITTASEQAKKEFLIGQQLADNLQVRESLKHFDNAIELDSSFASAYLDRANNSLTAKDLFQNLKEAMSHIKNASEGERLLILATDAGTKGDLNKQKECLEKLVALYPDDERAHVTLGGYFFGMQDYRDAIREYEKAIHIADRFAPAYNILGYAYRQVQQYEKAEKTFKRYTELLPNDPNPYDSYAELLLKMGRFDQSIDNYKKALGIDPNFTSSRIGLTMNYLYQGKNEKAAAEAEQLASSAHNDGERRQACFVKAVVDIDGGNLESALGDFDKEYAIGRNINDVLGMSGDLAAKANVLLEMGKYDDAAQTFATSVDLISHSDLSPELKKNALFADHYNRARIAIAKSDFHTAKTEIEEFSHAAEENKNANQIRFAHELKGIEALAEKNYDEALSELHQANQQDPYNLYRMALAYKAKGDLGNANKFCKQAAEFYSLPLMNYAFMRNRASKMLAAG
ncbi:MAG TPA: tetratricopeptide repeat protein [Bacteroidota bacterium]|nr:tetratricopeptide repeat protein [Bacteroidota bacterium]